MRNPDALIAASSFILLGGVLARTYGSLGVLLTITLLTGVIVSYYKDK
ncbi:hypothetical protein P5_0047 [Aeromonas phage P5]|nr:hypothetical protein P5_0047 [Aeromonas phage P5]